MTEQEIIEAVRGAIRQYHTTAIENAIRFVRALREVGMPEKYVCRQLAIAFSVQVTESLAASNNTESSDRDLVAMRELILERCVEYAEKQQRRKIENN